MKYRIEHLQDNVYQVIADVDDWYSSNVLFQGSLADCEAFIRLKQNPDVEF